MDADQCGKSAVPRPGGALADGALTLVGVRRILAGVVSVRADERLRLLDGLQLLGATDAGTLYDGLHPNQHGHDLIAARAAALLA